MQGHGRTRDVPREFSYEGMAVDVPGRLKHIKIEPRRQVANARRIPQKSLGRKPPISYLWAKTKKAATGCNCLIFKLLLLDLNQGPSD